MLKNGLAQLSILSWGGLLLLFFISFMLKKKRLTAVLDLGLLKMEMDGVPWPEDKLIESLTFTMSGNGPQKFNKDDLFFINKVTRDGSKRTITYKLDKMEKQQ